MARTSVKYVRWKIFFDGVEVPWVDFSVQTGIDSPGEATISLPPDPMLIEMRARTKVHIFMFDDLEDGVEEETKESDLKGYKMYWEGEVAAVVDNETPTSRQFAISARGVLAGLAKAKAFMLGAGAIGASPLITGSSLLWNDGVRAQTLLSLSSLGRAFDVNTTDVIGDSYAERALRLVSFLASHNAWLRLHTVRTGLIGKIAGIADRTLTHLIPRVLASPYFRQVGDGIGQDASALDVVSSFNNAVFHRFASVTLPRYGGPVPGHLAAVPALGSDNDTRYDLTKKFARNDYFILPEMYYAIPPACNLIFPEMNSSFGIQRNYDEEPTRAAVVDTQLATNLVVIAPDDLFRYAEGPSQGMRPEEVWGVNWKEVAGDPAKSPYLSPSGTNLFAALSDLEIERGVLPIMSVPPFQVFSAVVNTYDLRDERNRARLAADNKRYGDLFLRIGKDRVRAQSDDGQSYVYLLKTLAEYNLTLLRFTRRVQTSMHGHRWLVPGFPAVILRKGGSYLALVRGHRFSVDANGQETSAVDLDYVRPIPRERYIASEGEQSVEDSIEAVARAARALIEAYALLSANLGTLYQKALRALRVRPKVRPVISRGDSLPMYEAYSAYVRALLPIVAAFDVARRNVIFEIAGRASPMGVFTQRVTDLANDHADALREIDRAVEKVRSGTVLDASDIPAFGEPMITANIMAFIDAIKAVGKTLSKSIPLRQRFAFPPLFANEDLIRTDSAEKLYGRLLGSRPVFTERQGPSPSGRKESAAEETMSLSGEVEIARKNARAYADYMAFIHALSKIFPLGDDQNTEWDERANGDERMESVRDWEDREILRREGAQSLAEFLNVSGLSLTTGDSLRPTVTSFYILKPNNTIPLSNSQGKSLTWDDTIFSLVVSEKPGDPEIKRLRESVTDEYLTTKVRQEFWIEYSRRHWGARAHDLS